MTIVLAMVLALGTLSGCIPEKKPVVKNTGAPL